jgi:hypothetical protein
MKLTRTILITAFIFEIWLAALQLHAQGTAFTYNGKLDDGANPATGQYDLRFTIYNDFTNGTGMGAVTNSATEVVNGLFTATLDFGGVFTGAGYWLEVAVRTNGGGTFSVLSPRQPILPSPYAIYAANSGSAGIANSVSASNITGIMLLTQLPTAVVTNNQGNVMFNGTVSAGNFSGNGSGLTNLNAVTAAYFTNNSGFQMVANADPAGDPNPRAPLNMPMAGATNRFVPANADDSVGVMEFASDYQGNCPYAPFGRIGLTRIDILSEARTTGESAMSFWSDYFDPTVNPSAPAPSFNNNFTIGMDAYFNGGGGGPGAFIWNRNAAYLKFGTANLLRGYVEPNGELVWGAKPGSLSPQTPTQNALGMLDLSENRGDRPAAFIENTSGNAGGALVLTMQDAVPSPYYPSQLHIYNATDASRACFSSSIGYCDNIFNDPNGSGNVNAWLYGRRHDTYYGGADGAFQVVAHRVSGKDLAPVILNPTGDIILNGATANATNGNVGIGTGANPPSSLLDVNGQVGVDATNGRIWQKTPNGTKVYLHLTDPSSGVATATWTTTP